MGKEHERRNHLTQAQRQYFQMLLKLFNHILYLTNEAWLLKIDIHHNWLFFEQSNILTDFCLLILPPFKMEQL
jgi:hypothetical protein